LPPTLRKASGFPLRILPMRGFASGGGAAWNKLQPAGKPKAFRKGDGKAVESLTSPLSYHDGREFEPKVPSAFGIRVKDDYD
jgi:hypothetical protein